MFGASSNYQSSAPTRRSCSKLSPDQHDVLSRNDSSTTVPTNTQAFLVGWPLSSETALLKVSEPSDGYELLEHPGP